MISPRLCELPVVLIRDFLAEVDRRWRWPAAERIRLRMIGSAALMLQADYSRGTKDSDVLETDGLAHEARDNLLALAGPRSELHRRHRHYIDIVAAGLPFLPRVPVWHDTRELNATLQHFEITVLDIVDVVVSKLKRFSPSDEADIDAMIALELVPHDRLIARFKAAVESYEMDARAEKLPVYVRNLHRVERDLFGVPETEIELPPWTRDEV
jgi:hypothetical protein